MAYPDSTPSQRHWASKVVVQCTMHSGPWPVSEPPSVPVIPPLSSSAPASEDPSEPMGAGSGMHPCGRSSPVVEEPVPSALPTSGITMPVPEIPVESSALDESEPVSDAAVVVADSSVGRGSRDTGPQAVRTVGKRSRYGRIRVMLLITKLWWRSRGFQSTPKQSLLGQNSRWCCAPHGLFAMAYEDSHLSENIRRSTVARCSSAFRHAERIPFSL